MAFIFTQDKIYVIRFVSQVFVLKDICTHTKINLIRL